MFFILLFYSIFLQGANQLYKTVLQSEQASGVKERVCRKSVNRLLERMAASNLIKRFEIVVPYGDGTSATIVYFCDSTISMEDEVFRTVVNETKFRLKGIGMFIKWIVKLTFFGFF